MSGIALPLFRRDVCPAAAQLDPKTTRQWLFCNDQLLCSNSRPLHHPVSNDDLADPDLLVLGRHGDVTLVARDVDPAPDGQWLSLRRLLASLDHESLQAVMTARAGQRWTRASRYCGVCGSKNSALAPDWSRQCLNSQCGQRHFPRLDPAAIVLVVHGERCLLGRAPTWPEGRFSTLAGFVEPGETLEQSVVREVHEEAGVALASLDYVASQPWPFPSSLMLGFRAEAASERIERGDELAEVGWFSSHDIDRGIAEGSLTLPPEGAISRRLIDDWLAEQALA